MISNIAGRLICELDRQDNATPLNILPLLRSHAIYIFFFSSRRRHTRFDCDWSSDVCSSDLSASGRRVIRSSGIGAVLRVASQSDVSVALLQVSSTSLGGRSPTTTSSHPGKVKIGRASCRGRGEISVGAVSLKKKKRRRRRRR